MPSEHLRVLSARILSSSSWEARFADMSNYYTGPRRVGSGPATSQEALLPAFPTWILYPVPVWQCREPAARETLKGKDPHPLAHTQSSPLCFCSGLLPSPFAYVLCWHYLGGAVREGESTHLPVLSGQSSTQRVAQQVGIFPFLACSSETVPASTGEQGAGGMGERQKGEATSEAETWSRLAGDDANSVQAGTDLSLDCILS